MIYVRITFLYADVYLKTLMKCEGDIRKNRRITTSKSFEKSVQKTWKHHCWLCLSMDPSVITKFSSVILVPEQCGQRSRKGAPPSEWVAMEPGLLMRHSPRVKRIRKTNADSVQKKCKIFLPSEHVQITSFSH